MHPRHPRTHHSIAVRRRRLRRRWMPRWLRRHRLVYWCAALALAAVSANAIAGALADAQAERDRWGSTRHVLVARHRLDAGDVVHAGDVEDDAWPVAVVPPDAVGADDVVVGRTVVGTVAQGEAVLGSRLAPAGLHGVAALVPIGWRALAVPVGPAVVRLAVGDRIDLVAAVDGSGKIDADHPPSFVLAANALVVAVDEQSVTVAVPADAAPRVALGIVTNSVVPALRSG